MKKTLLAFTTALLLVATGCSSAPKGPTVPDLGSKGDKALKSTLKTDLANYSSAVKSKNVNAQLKYIYPTLFRLQPKSKLKKNMQRVVSNPASPKVSSMKFTKIAPIQNYSKGYFSMVDTEVDFLVKTKKKQSLDKENKQFIFGMFGKNIKITSNTNKGLGIKRPGRLLALKENKGTWKFIEQEKILTFEEKGLLPEGLVDKLK